MASTAHLKRYYTYICSKCSRIHYIFFCGRVHSFQGSRPTGNCIFIVAQLVKDVHALTMDFTHGYADFSETISWSQHWSTFTLWGIELNWLRGGQARGCQGARTEGWMCGSVGWLFRKAKGYFGPYPRFEVRPISSTNNLTVTQTQLRPLPL